MKYWYRDSCKATERISYLMLEKAKCMPDNGWCIVVDIYARAQKETGEIGNVQFTRADSVCLKLRVNISDSVCAPNSTKILLCRCENCKRRRFAHGKEGSDVCRVDMHTDIGLNRPSLKLEFSKTTSERYGDLNNWQILATFCELCSYVRVPATWQKTKKIKLS